jgi:hypothetical protein
MKNKVLMLFLGAVIVSLLSRCGCHSCLAPGESFDLPYKSNQTVKFINNSFQQKSFLANIDQSLPPNEYCGHVGSESYGSCCGHSCASLKSNNDSSAIITIEYRSENCNSDGVEQFVDKFVTVAKGTILIRRGVVSTINNIGSVKSGENIKINGVEYKNVYIYQNDLAETGNCSNFVYSTTAGILKYSIKRNDNIENWIIAK